MAENRALWIALAVAMAALVISSLQKAGTEKDQDIGKTPQILMGDGPMSLAKGGSVDEGKLRAMLGEDYNQVKETLGIKENFCIYFEDADGKVIPVSGDTLGLGSGKISVNEHSCRWG